MVPMHSLEIKYYQVNCAEKHSGHGSLFNDVKAQRRKLGLDARKSVLGVCEQQRCIPACASAQSDQRLCYSLSGKHYILS